MHGDFHGVEETVLRKTYLSLLLNGLPSAVEAAVCENMGQIRNSSAFVTNLIIQVASTIRPSIEDSFKESFTEGLIPSYQKATQAEFQQLHTAFQSGIEDFASAISKDHDSTEILSASVQKIMSTVNSIQDNVAQVAQAQSELVSANQQQYDQQRRSVTTVLQSALQGEDVASSSGFGSRRASQQASPVESKQTAAVN